MKMCQRYLLLIVLFLTCIQLIISNEEVTTCPIRYPYAFFNGAYCCLFNKEKSGYEYRGDNDDALCDGSELTPDSECCLENQFISCPGTTCQSLVYDTYPCPLDYPYAYYNGEYCCRHGFEKPSFSIRTLSFGCNGGNITRDSLCCLDNQHNRCANPPCANMDWWSLTWEAEGNEDESSPDFTRKLRVPTTEGYGVTLGRGYDMQYVLPGDIYGDLIKIGVSEDHADILANATTLNATQGREFLENNNMMNFTITRRQEWELFKIIRDSKIEAAKLVLSDNTSFFGYIDFDTLVPTIKAIVLDLFFRMDYFSNIHVLQPEIVKNDTDALKAVMADRTLWTEASDDRFHRRKTHIEL